VGLRGGAGVDDLAMLEAGHVRNHQTVRGGADLSGDERHHQQGSQGPAHLETLVTAKAPRVSRAVKPFHLVTAFPRPRLSWPMVALREPAPQMHVVQFYENERQLIDRVAPFLGDALERGEAVLVIARPTVREKLAEWLPVGESGQCVLLDARETL